MAKILLIETATEVCAAAVAVNGKIAASEELIECQNHAAVLHLQIEACARNAGVALPDIDAVAVSAGPGAYTSLRTGVAAAKGICFALNKPLIAIDTLYALAKAAFLFRHDNLSDDPTESSALYLPVLDARRNEVWGAVYSASMELLAPAQPFIIEDNLFENEIRVLLPGLHFEKLIFSGNGTKKIKSGNIEKKSEICPVVRCSAKYLAEAAESSFEKAIFQDIAYFQPIYQKPPGITESKKHI